MLSVKQFRHLALFSIACLPLLAPVARAANPVPAPVIMVIDEDRIGTSSKAYKALKAQADALADTYRREFSKKQADLQAAGQDLSKLRVTLSAEAFQDKYQDLQKRAGEFQRDAHAKQNGLEKGLNEGVIKIQRQLLDIVKQLADERHANLVIRVQALLTADPVYDGSDEALRRLDQRLTSVPADFTPIDAQTAPPPPGAAAAPPRE